MAILISTLEHGDPIELPLEGTVVIGSSEDSDVFVDHPGISPHHAEIYLDDQGNGWVCDLGSAAGTFVNDRRAGLRQLADGDVLKMGPLTARYVFSKVGVLATQPAAPAVPETSADPPVSSSKDATGPIDDKPADQSGPTVAEPSKTQPLIEDSETKTAAAPDPPKPSLEQASPSPSISPAKPRVHPLLKLFIMLVLTNAVLFIACTAWFYFKTKSDLESHLTATLQSSQPHLQQPAPVDKPSNADERISAIAKQVTSLEQDLASLKKELSADSAKMEQSAGQIAALSNEIKSVAAQIKTAADSAPAPPLLPVDATTLSQNELVLLKERNRLTEYADEAIATGSRTPYERLWEAMDDPRLSGLVHATRAEILRVQDCFINGRRVKFYGIQQHQIPVAEIFPQSAALAPAQLSDDQLITVLEDMKQSWQTRVKAAWLLGQRRSTKVGDALVRAIKSDPVLDVVAEATFSFEQITGYHAQMFDAKAIDAWWKNYTTKPPPRGPAPGSPPAEETGKD